MKRCLICNLYWENHRIVCPECCNTLPEENCDTSDKTERPIAYRLVEWPESQELMDFPWFTSECYLAMSIDNLVHEPLPAAYMIPENRYKEYLSRKEQ